MQRHMPKCFEGIEELTFRDSDSMITHMNSIEGESVKLNKSVNPLDNEQNPRGVEEWLFEIEKNMKTTLYDLFSETLKDYPKTPRK